MARRGAGTAQIRWGEIYQEANQDSIVLSAFQSAGFRKEVDRQLKNGFGRNRASLAQRYVNEAVDTIKKNLKKGLDRSGSIEGSGLHVGGVTYNYSFQDLAKSTKKAKKGRIGAGKFWLDHGRPYKDRDSLRDAIADVNPPKITYETKIVGLDRRRGPDRIDFEMTMSLSEMVYPLDEMVRRPLLTGEAPDGVSGRYEGTKLDVLAILEFGATNAGRYGADIPARPWISGFAAEVGNVMFDDLITNR